MSFAPLTGPAKNVWLGDRQASGCLGVGRGRHDRGGIAQLSVDGIAEREKASSADHNGESDSDPVFDKSETALVAEKAYKDFTKHIETPCQFFGAASRRRKV
jgi:hypothetical protein